MYLSRIQLNPHRREARQLLASARRVHGAVLASFPDPPVGDRDGGPRVLWRLDVDEHVVRLYVVSPDQPDFAHLAEQAGWPTTERGETRPYGPVLDRLALGQQWAFRLAANPTRYVTNPHTGKTKRMGHVTVRYQEQWLIEKAAEHGFAVTGTSHESADGEITRAYDLAVTRRGIQRFARPDAEDPVTLATAQFDGRLEVTDADALRRALASGIGPGKAYGCGLLTLAPV